ncbi:MAG: hypothetical protein AABZ60_11245 [Planctomycetota bacterium]
MKCCCLNLVWIGFYLLLMGCETGDYRTDGMDTHDIEKEVREDYRREEIARKGGSGGFTRTNSSEDTHRQTKRPIIEKSSKKYNKIEDIENDATAEVKKEPPKKESKTEKEKEVIVVDTEKKEKKSSDSFKKTKGVSEEQYVPEEDNHRVIAKKAYTEEELKLRGADSNGSITADGIIIAHPRKEFPPARFVSLWSDEYPKIEMPKQAKKELVFGPYSRFQFYQDFGKNRWNFDWIDISQELKELPISLEGWKLTEKKWNARDGSGENWDYGQSWAYEEDQLWKLVLVKSGDYWSSEDYSKPYSVLYCYFKFEEQQTRVFYLLRNEQIDPRATEIIVDNSKPYDFERFLEYLSKTLPPKNSNSPSK